MGQAHRFEYALMPVVLGAWLKGLAIGMAVAAPVGPMSVLCMRRTLAQGWAFGLGTGAGIAAGDGLFALVAAFGWAGIMRFMAVYERPLHLAAGALLLYLGWRTFFAANAGARPDAPRSASVAGAFGSALLLTLVNPPTIVSFVAVFATLAPAGFGAAEASMMAAGILCGSLGWWVLLSAVVAAARHAVGARVRRAIDRVSGAILGLLGGAEIGRAL